MKLSKQKKGPDRFINLADLALKIIQLYWSGNRSLNIARRSQEHEIKTLLALSLMLPPLAGLAADRDDRILPYGAENEPEYPHEVIRHEEKAADYEHSYQRGLIDQYGSDNDEQIETFDPAYQKGARDGMQP